MRTLVLSLFALTIWLGAQAHDYGQDQTITIWDNATAPHSNNVVGEQKEAKAHRLSNISQTELFVFKADEAKRTGQAVVICPGGGYGVLAMDNEGFLMAQWFAENGITAAILKYRLPNFNSEVPLEDAVEALRVMRTLASDYGFDSTKVGIVGSSAGGHLAASASTLAEPDQRPNFSILFYPVISGDSTISHKGTFKNLLGADHTQEQLDYFSLEKQVSATTPTTFLVLCDDDTAVSSLNSIRYYTALKQAGVQASMHIYPSGRHGWGAYDTFQYKEEWREALADWLKNLNKEE